MWIMLDVSSPGCAWTVAVVPRGSSGFIRKIQTIEGFTAGIHKLFRNEGEHFPVLRDQSISLEKQLNIRKYHLPQWNCQKKCEQTWVCFWCRLGASHLPPLSWEVVHLSVTVVSQTNPVLKPEEGGKQVLRGLFFFALLLPVSKEPLKKTVSEPVVSSFATWKKIKALQVWYLYHQQSPRRFRRSLTAAHVSWHLPFYLWWTRT